MAKIGITKYQGKSSNRSPPTTESDANKSQLVDLDAPNEKHKNGKKDKTLSPQPLSPSSGNGLPPSGNSPFNIVTVNVSGLRFQTSAETLGRYPATLLGDPRKRQQFYNAQSGEYFFDRHRSSFQSILYFYQSQGRLKRPKGIPVDIYVKELQFFQMGRNVLEKFWQSEGHVKPAEMEMPKNRYMKTVWSLMEHPDSSVCARIVAFFSVFVIVLSTLSFCLETVPELKEWSRNLSSTDPPPVDETSRNETRWENPSSTAPPSVIDWRDVFFVVEFSCICWFTVEFLLRILSCPSTCKFCKDILNIIDVIAIAPFFVNLCLSTETDGTVMPFAVLRIFRLVRVFRIFKLSRHSKGLQVLGKTFKASVQEFCLLIFFLALSLVLFSSAVFFAESDVADTQFRSIPEAFWYCVVTMTTVGYGDMVPKGPFGKVVGSFCAVAGVLVLAFPVPVIMANFKHFYKQEKRLQHMQALHGGADEEFVEDDSDSS